MKKRNAFFALAILCHLNYDYRQMSPFTILFENSEIYLINKPAGVPVQGGEGISHPLDDEFSKQVGYRIHLVHRLDKETAGILIVAKTSEAAAKWIKLIGGPLVSKEYAAVCIGRPVVNGKTPDSGTIRGVVEAHGREQSAETHFSVVKTARIPDTELSISLLSITLGTGRMHQIRIQLAKSKAPIAADDMHGDFKANKVLRKQGIKRLQLAAVKLTIPVDGSPRVFTIPLPEHMQAVADTFFGAQTESNHAILK